MPFPEEEQAKKQSEKNESCKDKCEVTFSMLEKLILGKKNIPLGKKIVAAGIIKTVSLTCKKCCAGKNSLVYDCLQILVDAYNTQIQDLEKGIKEGLYETEKGIYDLYGVSYQ